MIGPEELAALVDASKMGAPDSNEPSIYSAVFLPADIYLVDMWLCDYPKECTSTRHQENGVHSAAAGLLLGLFTSLRWPRQPQCIIPYSARMDEEETEQTWKICTAACPPTIRLAHDVPMKSKGSFSSQVTIQVPHEFRSNLEHALSIGSVHLPLTVRDRLKQSLVGDDFISADETIQLLYPGFGERKVALGALFNEFVEECSGDWRLSTAPIREWLNHLPETDPIEREARELASLYWNLANSNESRGTYQFMRWAKDDKAAAVDVLSQPTPTKFPSLLAWKEKHVRGQEVVRLAFLMLLVRDHASRSRLQAFLKERGLSQPQVDLAEITLEWANNEHLPEEELLEIVKEKVKSLSAHWDDNEWGEERNLIEKLEESAKHFKQFYDSGHSDDWLDLGTPVSEWAVIRMIDPFPGTWDQTSHLGADVGLGRALGRLFRVGDNGTLTNHRLLIQGEGTDFLTSFERACCLRIAYEATLGTEAHLPKWLSQEAN